MHWVVHRWGDFVGVVCKKVERFRFMPTGRDVSVEAWVPADDLLESDRVVWGLCSWGSVVVPCVESIDEGLDELWVSVNEL